MSVIDKSMGIIEIVQKYPQTVEVFRNYGMGCLGCVAARFENVEQGATAHGIDVAALIADLNKVIEPT
jgi:hybrid cluster-associated redox disulfide protein